ncbi:MAG: WYL domain-containing protein [Pseudoflavonifractor sp.]|nr:WYL domain-containing protein [Alloprevotella sp.]MCM1117511.1 WYL domain-containing protein [Pseudoflavonifractor sp.]
MAHDLLSRYIWLVDTIRRHGRITRIEINRLWDRSRFSNGSGKGLPRRTFYNYRSAIEELFGLTIAYDAVTYEYYIPATSDRDTASISDWMLNSAAMGSVVHDAQEASDRIFIEDVPSARLYLGIVITALKEMRPIRFTYSPYSRVNPTHDVVVEPYFLKLFRQRWYVTGRNVKDNTIKTYALDRMSDVVVETLSFELPDDFDAKEYVNDAFGIIFSQGKTYTVRLRADSRRAKYLRTLPLHHSQSERVSDEYSEFSYRLRLTGDLVNELLSFGPSITVLSPPELRVMMADSLRQTIALYDKKDKSDSPTQSCV